MGQITTKTEFARMKGWHKATVTRAGQSGRIVITADGMVDVDASEERLALTRDPYKDGVRERHAHERAAKGKAPADAPSPRLDTNTTSYGLLQESRAKAEAERATLLRMEREEREGKLADTAEVRRVAFEAARQARNAIFNLQHRLDPLLQAEPDSSKRAALWDAELRQLCDVVTKAAEALNGSN